MHDPFLFSLMSSESLTQSDLVLTMAYDFGYCSLLYNPYTVSIRMMEMAANLESGWTNCYSGLLKTWVEQMRYERLVAVNGCSYWFVYVILENWCNYKWDEKILGQLFCPFMNERKWYQFKKHGFEHYSMPNLCPFHWQTAFSFSTNGQF